MNTTKTNQITLANGERIVQTDKGDIKVTSRAGKTLSVSAKNLGDLRQMIDIIEFEEHLERKEKIVSI